MGQVKEILQRVVLPTDDFSIQWGLFYRYDRLVVSDGGIYIPAHKVVDFSTYVNGFSYTKWNRYTGIEKISLTLCMVGDCTIILTGYSLSPTMPIRHEYGKFDFSSKDYKNIEVSYPEITDEFIAFELISHTDCQFKDGYFSSLVEEKDVRDINLAIATTTFRKEKYITRNVAKIKESLIDSEEPISKHLFVNVVDNGKTLKSEDIESDQIKLFYNDNVGGAGGFSRGMMESIHMEPAITNVLLMDDDVLVLPESIRRLYTLLTLVKKEHFNSIVSGAMLKLDEMNMMTEDIGAVHQDGTWAHLKPWYDVNILKYILEDNREVPHHSHTYAAWWFCCVPASVIKKNGYALPIFIHGDDLEYGLRAQTNFITMSGICVWHMGFEGKFNPNTNYYQDFRNLMIIKATTGLIPEVDIFSRWKNECFRTALTFDYGGWELLLLAMEDYLKGPGFIEKDRGTELLKQHKQFAEQMTPLSPDTGLDTTIEEAWAGDSKMKLSQRVLYYLTYNGQRFFPERKLLNDHAVVRTDMDHKPGRCAFHKQLLAVDMISRSGHVRQMDKKKFSELLRRQKRDIRYYKKNNQQIEKEYRQSYKYITSEEFWRKYLKLDKE